MTDSKFGELLKKKRKEMGLTLEQAGSEIGVTRSMFSRYEKGNRFPSAAKLALIGERFDIPVLDYAPMDDEKYMKSFALHANQMNVPFSKFTGPPTVSYTTEEFDKLHQQILTDEPQGVEPKTSFGGDGRITNEVINHDRERLETALADCVTRLDNEYLKKLVEVAEILEEMQNKRKGQTN